jgi:cellulose biosynthesis protein BcsQ
MIISMVQTKGGVGKSTVGLLLAYSRMFHKKYGKIAIVELDKQRTLSDFFDPRSSKKNDTVDFYCLAEASDQEVEETLIHLVDTHDLIIMDIPGESVGQFATSLALHISSLVLMPMSDSVNDERAFLRNLQPEILPFCDKVPFYILPNFIHPATKAETVRNYFESWVPEEIHILNNYLSYRGTVYRGFSDDGRNLLDYAKEVKANKKLFEPARAAAKEVEIIAQELIEIMEAQK